MGSRCLLHDEGAPSSRATGSPGHRLLLLAIRDPIDANLEIALALGHVHIFWLEKVDVILRLDAHELVLRRQLCLTCKRIFAR